MQLSGLPTCYITYASSEITILLPQPPDRFGLVKSGGSEAASGLVQGLEAKGLRLAQESDHRSVEHHREHVTTQGREMLSHWSGPSSTGKLKQWPRKLTQDTGSFRSLLLAQCTALAMRRTNHKWFI